MVSHMEAMNMTGKQKNAYGERFSKVVEYIDVNLHKDIEIDELSAVANFSKFHFHRQFSKYIGLSVARYVQLMRLKRASHRLVFDPRERILDIALDSGFENPESFSRAFKQAFGQTPSAFRRKPDWMSWQARYRFSPTTRMKTMDVRIIETETVQVAAMEHRGHPELVNACAMRFIAWHKESGLPPLGSIQTYGIAYDDPEVVAPEEFRFDICCGIKAAVPANSQGVVAKTIPGGRCAVVHHVGSHDRLGDSVSYMFREWLPGSGEELRDFPLYFQYLNNKFDTPEHELKTDIYLPLK